MPSSHLILWCPLLLLPPIPPSIRVFSNESTLRMRWPKYWSFSFTIIPSKEHPGLISFRIDWLDLLAVQGTLKSLLQHHSSKASILLHSAFFIVQLSNLYMTTGKTTALTSAPQKNSEMKDKHDIFKNRQGTAFTPVELCFSSSASARHTIFPFSRTRDFVPSEGRHRSICFLRRFGNEM